MTENQAAGLPHMPIFALSVHKLALPIVLFWIGLVVVFSLFVPPLDKVAKQHQVSMKPQRRPVDAGDEARRQAFQRVQQRQRHHDRPRRRQTARRRRAPFL